MPVDTYAFTHADREATLASARLQEVTKQLAHKYTICNESKAQKAKDAMICTLSRQQTGQTSWENGAGQQRPQHIWWMPWWQWQLLHTYGSYEGSKAAGQQERLTQEVSLSRVSELIEKICQVEQTDMRADNKEENVFCTKCAKAGHADAKCWILHQELKKNRH
jgi:hypothetical protein